MKSFFIKISIVSFLASVFLFERGEVDYLLLFGFLGWACLIAFFLKKQIVAKVLVVVIIFGTIGYLRMQFVHPIVDSSSIHYYQSEDVMREIEGVIVKDPDRRRTKVNYIMDAQKLDGNDVEGRLLFSMDLYPEFEYGDRVKIRGTLMEPMEFDTFSYKDYLSLSSVYSVMYYPRVNLVDKHNESWFMAMLFNTKKNFEYQLNKIMPEPMASFEAGLLTGSRKGIPDDLLQNFNLTGLTHIIAISGYNISLIIVLISGMFKNTPRNIKIPIIIFIIVVFTLFVGASAAVVRASIMGVIAVIALWFGRQSQVLNALLMSGFVMIMYNPLTLVYDVGFQLSFLATLGLILTGNHLEKLFRFVPDVFGLREAFAMTFSAQIFALPVIVVNFKRFSLISPVANVFVVPFIPFAMLFGFIGVLTSYLFFDFGFILIFPAWLALKYIVFITDVLAKLPLAAFDMPWFSVWFLIGYYVLCILFAYLIYPYFRNVLARN